MIAVLVVATIGVGAIVFLLIFILAIVQESGRRGSRSLDPRRKSLTFVMLERFRNDKAA